MFTSEVPIFPEETLSYRISGFSGSFVYLVRSSSNVLFVRKASANVETSYRLEQQYNKLLAFQNYNLTIVNSPKILKTGYYRDRFYMDLEYVSGVDLVEYMATASVSGLKHIGERLGTFLIEMGKHPPIEKVPENVTQVFFNKTFTLLDTCSWLPDCVKVNLFLNVNNIAKLMESKSSLCHGDLTLENILIDKNGQIWLLDHLDSFYPHYWQDISKLHQDLSGEWFRFRRPGLIVPKYALSYLSNCLLEKVSCLDPSYLLVHNGLLALVFARILPYTSDNITREFVISRLSYYLNLSLEKKQNIF
jgi:serine/threonine protein kinase